MACNCYKYASDYRRMCDLAQKMANKERVNYAVYQKEDKSYNFMPEFLIADQSVQFIAKPC